MRTIGWALLGITSFFVGLCVVTDAAKKAVEEQLKGGNLDFAQALHGVATTGCYAYLLVLLSVWLLLLATTAKPY